MTTEEAKKLTTDEIAKYFREAARAERGNYGVTWEYGCDLITIIAVHGDVLADAIFPPNS